VPPVFLPFSTEHAAFRKALSMARPADTIYLVSNAPEELQPFWPSLFRQDVSPTDDNGFRSRGV
jgi:hypothetical protein